MPCWLKNTAQSPIARFQMPKYDLARFAVCVRRRRLKYARTLVGTSSNIILRGSQESPLVESPFQETSTSNSPWTSRQIFDFVYGVPNTVREVSNLLHCYLGTDQAVGIRPNSGYV